MAKIPTVHNPSNFEPSDYEVVNYLDNKRPVFYGQDFYAEEVEGWKEEMIATFGGDYASKIHHCAHCGNGNVRWITATKHIPTGDVVVFGSDCTKRLGFADKFAFKLAQLMAKAEAVKVRFAVYLKREAFLKENAELATLVADIKNPAFAKNFFVQDVIGKLNHYGNLSPRQVSAVIASMKRDLEKMAAPVVAEVKGDAKSGRFEAVVEVLSMKVQEGFYGSTLKMLVKFENASKGWVTVPSKADVVNGEKIKLTATWEVSNDDKSFAFGKRPVVAAA